jgi:hypothetical protein
VGVIEVIVIFIAIASKDNNTYNCMLYIKPIRLTTQVYLDLILS